MNFAATEDHELLRQTVREFAEKEARPSAAARDEAMEWPADLVKKMGQLGFLGVAVGVKKRGGWGPYPFLFRLVPGARSVGAPPGGGCSSHKSPCFPERGP